MTERGPRLLLVLVLTCFGMPGAHATPDADLSLYDWMGTAPIVVQAEVVREGGKYTEVKIARVVRGDIEPDAHVLVRLREANRKIAPERKLLELPRGARYLFLLRPAPPSRRLDLPPYDLVRNVDGARVLPAEGAGAWVDAAVVLARIQDQKNEAATWHRMRDLLEDTNPILIVTAMEQHRKFHRARAGDLPLGRPLLDHPRADVREGAARLIADVLTYRRDDPVPERADLYDALAGHARSDPVVSVRVAATEALPLLEEPGTEALLRQIAEHDPDQQVRFAASKLLYEREMPPASADASGSLPD